MGCPCVKCADLLLCGCGFASFDFGGGVGVFLGEAFDAASGVDEFLLAGKERVAIGADFDVQHVALDGRTGGEIVAAGAVHRDGVIVGVDTGFHKDSILSRPVCTASPTGLGHYSRVARSRGNLLSYAKCQVSQNRG